MLFPLYCELRFSSLFQDIKSTGTNITVTINAYRYEIQYHDLNVSYKSEEKTKWFFDNMTEYLDSLLTIQEKVAKRITEEVEEVLKQVSCYLPKQIFHF